MATTIQRSFSRFKSNLEITGLQVGAVSKRQKGVRDAVAGQLTVLTDFLTGSYSRSTLIAPLSKADIDIFVILDSSYYYNYSDGKNGGQAGLLDRLRRCLIKTYPKSPRVSRSGQAVTITFTDFLVDVVPAFHRKGGGYLIPNALTSLWLETDPKSHVSIMAKANAAHASDLVPMVKMIKAWNRSHSSLFRSFHLEVLALEVFEGITISDYPSGARYFFDKARARVALKNPDPAGYGDDVGSYINVANAQAKLELAYDRALKAEEFASRGAISDAVGMWRLIFGDQFPAFG